MRGIEMTRYTFRVEQMVTVTLHGRDTDENREKAEQAAILKAKKQIDENDLECVSVDEYEDYERFYKEQKEAV